MKEHGAESFLTSKKLAPFAGCVWDVLERDGATLAESASDIGEAQESDSSPEASADSSPADGEGHSLLFGQNAADSPDKNFRQPEPGTPGD